METPMKELLDLLQVQNPLRQQMLNKEKELIVQVYQDGYCEAKLEGKPDAIGYLNLLIYGK